MAQHEIYDPSPQSIIGAVVALMVGIFSLVFYLFRRGHGAASAQGEAEKPVRYEHYVPAAEQAARLRVQCQFIQQRMVDEINQIIIAMDEGYAPIRETQSVEVRKFIHGNFYEPVRDALLAFRDAGLPSLLGRENSVSMMEQPLKEAMVSFGRLANDGYDRIREHMTMDVRSLAYNGIYTPISDRLLMLHDVEIDNLVSDSYRV